MLNFVKKKDHFAILATFEILYCYLPPLFEIIKN